MLKKIACIEIIKFPAQLSINYYLITKKSLLHLDFDFDFIFVLFFSNEENCCHTNCRHRNK